MRPTSAAADNCRSQGAETGGSHVEAVRTLLFAGASWPRSFGGHRRLRRRQAIVGLITKTDTNPFFVKMREGAEAKAKELGVDLQTFAGKSTATMTARSRRSRT